MAISITHDPSTSWMGKVELDSMLTLEPSCLDSSDRPRSRTYASEGRDSVKIKELLVAQT